MEMYLIAYSWRENQAGAKWRQAWLVFDSKDDAMRTYNSYVTPDLSNKFLHKDVRFCEVLLAHGG
jgi:hypothetical protein